MDPLGEGRLCSKVWLHGHLGPYTAVSASSTAWRVQFSAKCEGSISAAAMRTFQPYSVMALAASPPTAEM